MKNSFNIGENISPAVEMAKDEKILTMAFVNMQPLDELYRTDDALSNGTLFKNLNKPFYGGRAEC
ncbi:MAG: spore coat associated protein CotJA [Clostridia bacterium]|nr:spore coat associated protein CotJA [Clostridia bacterium]